MLTLKAAILVVTCFFGPGLGDYVNDQAVSFENINGAIRYERTDGAVIVTTQACFAWEDLPTPEPPQYSIQCHTDGTLRLDTQASSYKLLGDGLLEWIDTEEGGRFLVGNAACRIAPLN